MGSQIARSTVGRMGQGKQSYSYPEFLKPVANFLEISLSGAEKLSQWQGVNLAWVRFWVQFLPLGRQEIVQIPYGEKKLKIKQQS